MTPERRRGFLEKFHRFNSVTARIASKPHIAYGDMHPSEIGEWVRFSEVEAAFLALEKEVREGCAKVCDLAARQYRQMKTSFIIEHGLYDDKEPDPDEAGDAECEELAYCCELNAKAIRALGEEATIDQAMKETK